MKPSEHPWNQPALLRDVIEARNFVVRTNIELANSVSVLVVAVFAVNVMDALTTKHGDRWWIGLVFVGIVWGYYFFGRNKPTPDLERSEQTANELPRPGAMFYE